MIVHRNPEYWPEPETFRPERFDGSMKIDPLAYLPFGAGAKACVGSHLALLILQLSVAHIFRHYQLSTPVKSVAINPFTTLKPITEMQFTAMDLLPETEKLQVKTRL